MEVTTGLWDSGKVSLSPEERCPFKYIFFLQGKSLCPLSQSRGLTVVSQLIISQLDYHLATIGED